MAQVTINLASIKDLDGGAAGQIIDAEIRKAVSDLDDRGDDGKPRSVVVTLHMQRMEQSDANKVWVEAHAKLPSRRTGNTTAINRPTASGEIGLLFQQHSPGNPYQRTLDEAEEAGKQRDDA